MHPSEMPDEPTLRRVLDNAGLGDVVEDVLATRRSGLRLVLARAEVEVGASKIGGRPDLASGVAWPVDAEGNPLIFLAQFDLAKVHRVLEGASPLPESGLLSFFFGTEQDEIALDGDDQSRCVIYSEGMFERLGPPENSLASLIECAVETVTVSLLPDFDSVHLDTVFDDAQRDRYIDALEPFEQGNHGSDDHRFLGHPGFIQGDPRYEASDDWVFLFQIDSEDAKHGMMWGDAGQVYFYVHRESIRDRSFSRVIAYMDCS